MFKKIVLISAILTFSIFAVGQNNREPQPIDGPSAEQSTTTCSFTFNSGTGENATKFCVTANGNITQFSNPAGNDHIAGSGWDSEGYAICDLTGGVGYFDYATNESGNWLPTALLSSTPALVKLSRTTSDGIWQITQTITRVNANAKSTGSAKISMAVKNLSGVSRQGFFLRYVDIDANNDYLTDDTVGGKRRFSGQDAYSHGLALTSSTTDTLNQTIVYNSNGFGPDPCNLPANGVGSGVFHGDGSAALVYVVSNFPKGATKTFSMTYQPY
jgi:hypothetical protein